MGPVPYTFASIKLKFCAEVLTYGVPCLPSWTRVHNALASPTPNSGKLVTIFRILHQV